MRNAKLAPRNTIPKAAIVSGTNSVRVIDAYASGKQVHSTTKTKINHTWLASHTGADRVVDHLPRPAATLRAAGDEVPEPGTEVRPTEHCVAE